MINKLQTDITLRPWQTSDLDNLVRYANNPAIADMLTDLFPHPYTIEHGRAFIERAKQQDGIYLFAISRQGEAVGSIGLHPQTDVHRLNAELGYWLAEPYQGQGIMSRAIMLMLDFAFRSTAVERVFARPFGHNVASRRVLEKCGFELEAVFRETLIKKGIRQDEYIFAYRKSQWKREGV